MTTNTIDIIICSFIGFLLLVQVLRAIGRGIIPGSVREYAAWMDSRLRDGRGFAEIHEEEALRVALARVRRIASEEIMRRPKDAWAIAHRVLADEISRLPKETANRMREAAKAFRLSDIIDQGAYSAWWKSLDDIQPVLSPAAVRDHDTAFRGQR